MVQIDSDLLWLIPIVLQATETCAATAHMAAQKTAIISADASLIQAPKYVPFIAKFSLNRFIYFIPAAIARAVRLVVFNLKVLTLKVRGSGQ